MILAVTYDFENIADYRREGVGVYAKHLLFQLMKYDKDLKLEFWTYKFNKYYLKLLFADIFKKYGSRVKICILDDKIIPDKSKFCLYLPYLADYYLKRVLLYFKYLFNKHKYNQKLAELYYSNFCTLFNFNSPYFIKNIQTNSQADAVYMLFVVLNKGKYFLCPKFMQVHDLFTIRFKEIFKNYYSDDYNIPIINNLADYALKDTTFISSSKFTVREQVLKCVPNINYEKTEVINYPPMIKSFENIKVLSKEKFKSKFGITERYIAMPCMNRPNKNWGVIFKAIAILKKKGINIQFVTTGKVADIKEDSDLVNELGIRNNILEIGSISDKDLYMLYKYEDIAVGSTYIEGMGISSQVIEALKIGNIPAVHSKCYGIKESLSAVGLSMENADLNWFEPDDSVTLANFIEDALTSPQKHIDKQKHVFDAYNSITWEKVCENYIKLFKRKIFEKEYTSPNNTYRSYAQYGEDMILRALFQHLFSKDILNIQYVDIGANHPIELSNTYYFYKNGGYGILVEPNINFIPMYKKYRPNDTVFNAGIRFGNATESAIYYDFGDIANGLNTFSEDRKNKVIKYYPLKNTIELPLIDINKILNKMEYIDFMSIDVEGMELNILKTIDFDNNKLRPKIFCIEANKTNLNCGLKSDLVNFMESKDYIYVADNFINVFFADKHQINLPENTDIISYDNN